MQFDFKQKPIKVKSVVISILISFLIGSLIILLSGTNPLTAFQTMIKGAVGSKFAISSSIRWATPLIFTGLAAATTFRCGMFNIGVEGQMYIGAFFAAWAGFTFTSLPPYIHILLCLLFGVIGGVIWAIFPAIMRVKFGASEMVMTLMLNYVAMNLTDYLTRYHFLASGVAGHSIISEDISENAVLPRIWSGSSAHWGILIGIICVILFWFIIKKTSFGYELHVCGINPEFAKYGGVKVDRVMIKAMLLSGAFAGLAGATEVMGVLGRYMSGFSPDFGFDGIVVALLGANSPFGVGISAFFLGLVKAGSLQLERAASISRSIAMIIQGLMVTFISCSSLGSWGKVDSIFAKAKERLVKTGVSKKGNSDQK